MLHGALMTSRRNFPCGKIKIMLLLESIHLCQRLSKTLMTTIVESLENTLHELHDILDVLSIKPNQAGRSLGH